MCGMNKSTNSLNVFLWEDFRKHVAIVSLYRSYHRVKVLREEWRRKSGVAVISSAHVRRKKAVSLDNILSEHVVLLDYCTID
jgi:hypothetical protein